MQEAIKQGKSWSRDGGVSGGGDNKGEDSNESAPTATKKKDKKGKGKEKKAGTDAEKPSEVEGGKADEL